MKKILLTTICLAFAAFSFSQQLSRYVISSGGNYSTSASGISLSSTIGETMVTTLTSASNVLNQGFQQSFTSTFDPTITIINPLNGDIFPNNNNVGIDFAVSDFVVAAGTGDGHIHYYVNGAMTMKYDTLPITLNGLANGSHQVIIELVDNSHQGFSPTIADTVNFSVNVISGCTGPSYCNYDSLATIDDGSCTGMFGCTDPLYLEYSTAATCDDGSCVTLIVNTSCGVSPITGLGVTNVIHDRVTLTFDDMNTYDASGAQLCRVDQLRIKYREVGTSSWSQKNMAAPTGYDPTTGICNSTQNTDKLVLGLTASTTYEWEMRVWYCATGATAWVVGPNFTTASNCPDVGNLAVTSGSNTQATFTWDDSNGAYSFVRLQARVDTVGSSFFNIGGIGVSYPAFTKNKNGLVPGESYRAKSRTWCDPSGGAYKAPSWTSFIYWTQPGSIRIEGGSTIANLTVYPNPSRDKFNISFASDTKQDLKVRILNIIGEELINENLDQFIGEYTKQIDLSNYALGIYFLEIETTDGIINKKLILQ